MNIKGNLRRELESAQEDLDRISQRVDYLEAFMRAESSSVKRMVTTLKAIIKQGSLDKKEETSNGGTT